jgi:PKHD-type hydroxylase C-terminal domain
VRKGENPRHPRSGCDIDVELLFDLDTARRQMFAREGKSSEFDLVSKSLANLLRMWVED